MKLLIIAAAAILVTGIRLLISRSRRSGAPSHPLRMLTQLNLFGEIGLIAGREIRERFRSRMFRSISVVLLLLVGAAVILPGTQSASQSQTIGLVAGTRTLENELHAVAAHLHLTITIVNEADMASARTDLAAGSIDMVLNGTTSILVKAPFSATDTSSAASFVRDTATLLGEQHAYADAKLTPEQMHVLSQASPLPITSLTAKKSITTTGEATALIGVVLIFIVLGQYLSWTLMGVMEEKSSRVVEVLLATVRPIQLLAGKVIGIGVVALTQAISLVVVALVLSAITGSKVLSGSAPTVILVTLLWLILGYAFYSWVYAAAGSLAERQDQVQSLVLPLSAPLIFGYIVSLIGVSTGSPSLLVTILAYIPPTAPFAMTTLVGFGVASWWQVLISVMISLISTVLVALLAARIYRAAVLQTGGRVHLRELRLRSPH